MYHEGNGLNDHTKRIAQRLATLGHAAFAMDYYGGGKPLANPADSRLPVAPWMADPTGIRALANKALETLAAQEEVDPGRLAAIGYRFGDTISLEIARSSADMKAIVGFPSGLATARPQDAENIKGEVLVCTGVDDPIIPREQRAACEKEMQAAGCDCACISTEARVTTSPTPTPVGGTGPGFSITPPPTDAHGTP